MSCFRIGRLAVAFCVILGPGAALGQQQVIASYDEARADYFWALLYGLGGQTVYCDVAFGPDRTMSLAGQQLTIEHAYPASWIARALGCASRNACDHPVYGYAEADLHNLWPALGSINASRGNQPFAELPGERHRRFGDICPDYERSSGGAAVVEPRDDAKGELARSMLYMADAYDLPLHGMRDLLLAWHALDPPDAIERWRNLLVAHLQGVRNPYIDGDPPEVPKQGDRRPGTLRQ